MPMQPSLKTFAHGLRAVFVPCEAESVAVGVFVASGSRHETARTAGISHFVEHMLFKGTPTRKPIDITRAIEGRGGNFNACTGEESTCYFAHLPDEYLAEAIDILSDMYLRATIPEDEFAREKQVIVEEIRMYADEPDSVAMENLQRGLFPQSRLGAPVAGTPASLAPMRPDDLRRHLKRHYLPTNTVIVIAGSFDPDRAAALVERAFRDFRPPPRRPRRAADSPLAGRPVAAKTVTREIAQAQLALGYRTFGVHDRRKYAATVMDAVLGRGMSSRLFQEVRERRGLSYDISSRMQFFADAGMFTVAAGLDPKKAQAALATIDREFRRICEKPVPAAELKRTKEFLTGNFRLSHERVASKLFFYGQTLLAFGRLVAPAEQVEGIRAVTAADVQAVARSIFQPSNRSISWVVPK
ncbi:MAG: M16 family metallopeptidase [Kiritimatiellia bacterium]